MEGKLIGVLIVDDEQLVRSGLKVIIDWNEDGFQIIGEAGNGEDALQKIRELSPELVLLDIRMPKVTGTELIRRAREAGYEGEFIILSGYSDFSYAQTALRYGAASYLTKPIDETELERSLRSVRSKIEERHAQAVSVRDYIRKARVSVILDILEGQDPDPLLDYREMKLLWPVYQVLVYEWFPPYEQSFSFINLLAASGKAEEFESLTIDGRNIILLKGSDALNRFRTVLHHYEEGPQKGSPLDGIFIAYGPVVTDLSQITESYEVCLRLISRRFFCDENQHVMSWDMLPAPGSAGIPLDEKEAARFSAALTDCIQSFNREGITENMNELRSFLYTSDSPLPKIRYFLEDVILQVKSGLTTRYPDTVLPFDTNSAVIEFVEKQQYLYEILCHISGQFEQILSALGNHSSESVFNNIRSYIEHNYAQPLKLESIAPLFGYNSAYLGKLFTRKTGKTFNTYLDELRIQEACRLLKTADLKVYEITARVGYRNVDYFHQKFKKFTGMSPAEFRSSGNSPES